MIHLDTNIETYLLFSFILLIIAGSIAGVIYGSFSQKKRKEELFAEWEAEGEEGPELEETEVRILEKHCMAKLYGTKMPQSRKEFSLTFQTQDGKKLTYAVEEDVYLALEENQHGTLATVNGNFYGFCPDEEV